MWSPQVKRFAAATVLIALLFVVIVRMMSFGGGYRRVPVLVQSPGATDLSNPMYVAITSGGSLDTVQQVLARNPGAVNRKLDGETPLYLAAEYGREDIVELLLAKGADPNITGRSHEPPIVAAIDSHNPGILRDLIEHGADVRIRTMYGHDLLQYAQSDKPWPEAEKLLTAALDRQGRSSSSPSTTQASRTDR